MAPLPAARLPTVDIGPLLRDNAAEAPARGAVAAEIAAACASHGTFYCVNSGITAAQRAAVLSAGESFFAQPPAAKRAVGVDPVSAARGFARGYIGIGGESGSADLREVKEGYSYGYDWPALQPPENALQGPNAWPADDAVSGFDAVGFQTSLNDVYMACYRVSKAIAAGLATALDEPALLESCQGTGGETISLMRMFRYLPYGDDPRAGESTAVRP